MCSGPIIMEHLTCTSLALYTFGRVCPGPRTHVVYQYYYIFTWQHITSFHIPLIRHLMHGQVRLACVLFVYLFMVRSFLFAISVSHTAFLLPGPAVARAVGAAVGTAATGTSHMTSA